MALRGFGTSLRSTSRVYGKSWITIDLSEHLYAFVHLLSPEAPERAKAWVEEKLAALLTDRVGDV